MQRRQFHRLSLGSVGLLIVAAQRQAWALSLSDLTDKDAAAGIRTALEKGALAAVALLGKTDGFLGNPKVRIPLPGYLEDAAKLLSFAGQGKRVDELITGMNRAAEQAVPLGKDLLVGAVKSMSVTDAKNILGGGDNSVTQFFADKTRAPLSAEFMPTVKASLSKLGVVDQFNAIAAKLSGMGLLSKDKESLEAHVTDKTLSGLYFMIAEEEKKIRENPVARTTDLLRKVFGASA